jgi:hypothetical protein
VTRPATVTAWKRASAQTNASEPRGVLAATSPSGPWAIPRVEATAKPAAADWAYAAHLSREEVRPIGAVTVTRNREASMAASGGALQVHIVRVRHYTDVRKRLLHPFEGALKGQGKEQGTTGIPLAQPTLTSERGRVGGCTSDDQRPVELIGPRGEREEAGCLGGHGLQQGRPGHAAERVPEAQLQGHVPGAARQARPEGVADALATPRDADSELQGGRCRTSVLAGGYRAVARKADPHLTDGDMARAAAPRLCKSDEGGGVKRGDVGKDAADDQVHQCQDGRGRGGRGASGCPKMVLRARLGPVRSHAGGAQDTLASLVTTGAGAEAGGTWGGASRESRAARLSRVAAAGGAVQKVPEAGDNSASAAPGGTCIRQGTGGEGEKVGHGVLNCLGRPWGGTPRG